jgi:hypothetical protein
LCAFKIFPGFSAHTLFIGGFRRRFSKKAEKIKKSLNRQIEWQYFSEPEMCG